MKRIFDIVISILLLCILFLPALLIIILVKLTDRGEVFYLSDRVGADNQIFKMPKFRTMKTNTPVVATHLLKESRSYLTPIGSFLRKTSLDEIPQLVSVLKGDMSLVGPRPALFNQYDLIELRNKYGVSLVRPGITGWAQINGRDELDIETKAELDRFYTENQSLLFDIRIIVLTCFKVFMRSGVLH